MGQALYRKYRSRSLDEIVGQDHITSTFKNALKTGKISHAYLLTGPRGVGKTSIARILAHAINELPYSEDSHLDIIEIDAASNRRIDEIRDLREKVSTAPTSAKYKVYIIDEVHMLTKEAFNALLKTLEEPPQHVIFILATTEGHKLPQTIISRTQRFTFLPVAKDQVMAHLRHIADTESIAIDDAALALIAEHGEGSFRDSISLLDQVSSGTDTVTEADVLRVLGRAPTAIIEEIVHEIENGSLQHISERLTELLQDGFDASVIASQISGYIRERIVSGNNQGITKFGLPLLRALLSVPGSPQPRLTLELALFDAALAYSSTGQTPQPLPSPPIHPKSQAADESEKTSATEPHQPTNAKPETMESKPEPKKSSVTTKDLPASEPATDIASDRSDDTTIQPVTRDFAAEELWQEVLKKIKQKYNTLYGIARMAKPRLEGDTLHLSLRFAFHIKRLKEPKNLKLLTDATGAIRGVHTPIVIELDTAPPGQKSAAKPAGSEAFSTISNIFGGGELL